jgi:hypothetical protein
MIEEAVVAAAAVAVDSVVEEAAAAAAAEAVVAAVVSDQLVLVRCTKQLAQTAVRKLKCLLYPILKDRCTAEIATKIINQRDINPELY